jgi:hypothetical protein
VKARKLPNKFDQLNARYYWLHRFPPITIIEMILGIFVGIIWGGSMWARSFSADSDERGLLRWIGTLIIILGFSMPFFLYDQGKEYREKASS